MFFHKQNFRLRRANKKEKTVKTGSKHVLEIQIVPEGSKKIHKNKHQSYEKV